MIETTFKFNEINNLKDQINYSEDKVQFKNIFNNSNGGVALVGFKSGQKLDEHIAPAELMVNVLEGTITFTVVNTPHKISAGEFMLVGEGVLHQVYADTDSKLMLVKVKA